MPRKDQRPCDDRNLAWSSDKGRFGFQMLEKMGWKEGKGLGANEDGITEHIKIRKRPENQGIGVDTSNPSKNWLTTSVAYDSILANLNASYSSKVQTTESAPAPAPSLVSRGVVGRPRKVLYSRILRAKDIKNYSSEDKSAIFGGLPKQEATAKESNPTKKEDITLLEVGSESEEDGRKQMPEEKKSKEIDMIHGVTTTTSAVSMQDYFKLKMAEMANKQAALLQSTDTQKTKKKKKKRKKGTEDKDKSQCKKKAKTKKRKKEHNKKEGKKKTKKQK